jgi:hypothetical protein
MKLILLLATIFTTGIISYSQTIPNFKSDMECLRFVQSKIKGMEDFYFDTLFSKAEKKKLTPQFESWKKVDVNGDKKPDLLLIGAFAKSTYKPNAAVIYLSNGNSYDLFPIVREGGTSFRPHVFTQKIKDKTLLIVHNYHFSNFEKVETLLKKNELSRETCAGDDTLLFKLGSIIDFSSHPSKMIFDSVILVRKFGWSCNIDSFIIYNKGNGQYFHGCNSQNRVVKSFQESIPNIKYLKNLIQTIDLKKIQNRSIYGGTDNNSAIVRIYHSGRVEEFFDYGLESSFTLKAIYKYFEELQREL